MPNRASLALGIRQRDRPPERAGDRPPPPGQDLLLGKLTSQVGQVDLGSRKRAREKTEAQKGTDLAHPVTAPAHPAEGLNDDSVRTFPR